MNPRLPSFCRVLSTSISAVILVATQMTRTCWPLGSGRAGRGGQGWLTYSFSPRNQVQVGYRLQEVSPRFMEGGRLVDYSASGNFMLSHEVMFSGLLQYEQWRFPLLDASRQSDVTASLTLTFYPHWRIGK